MGVHRFPSTSLAPLLGGFAATDPASSDGPTHGHAVGLFESHDTLVDTVVSCLAEALGEQATAVVIATADHAVRIREGLVAAGLDLDELPYFEVDAEQLLESFMVDHEPDRARFDDIVGDLVAEATAQGRPVHCFGEMVSVLWDQGNLSGVLALEDLWNDLAQSHAFELLCGYLADPSITDAAVVQEVCARHSTVLDTPPSDTEAALERLIAERVEAGELVTRREHEQLVRGWADRLRRAQATTERIQAANDGLMDRLRKSQASERRLRARIRRLRHRLAAPDDDGGTAPDG